MLPSGYMLQCAYNFTSLRYFYFQFLSIFIFRHISYNLFAFTTARAHLIFRIMSSITIAYPTLLYVPIVCSCKKSVCYYDTFKVTRFHSNTDFRLRASPGNALVILARSFLIGDTRKTSMPFTLILTQSFNIRRCAIAQ